MSFSSVSSSLRGASVRGVSGCCKPRRDGSAGLRLDSRSADNLRFLGFDDDTADDVDMGTAFDKFSGVDSSSGLKSSSSPLSYSARSCRCFWADPKILDSRALLLKFPIFHADEGCAGVARSLSNPMLLDLALRPNMLGCRGRLLKFPSDKVETFLFGMLARPLLSAWFDSTLLDRTREAPRPRMLG